MFRTEIVIAVLLVLTSNFKSLKILANFGKFWQFDTNILFTPKLFEICAWRIYLILFLKSVGNTKIENHAGVDVPCNYFWHKILIVIQAIKFWRGAVSLLAPNLLWNGPQAGLPEFLSHYLYCKAFLILLNLLSNSESLN